MLIKDTSSLRNAPLNFWEAQRVILTCCVIEMPGDTDIPNTQYSLYILYKGENTFLSTSCCTFSHGLSVGSICTLPFDSDFLVKQFYIFLISPHPHSLPQITKHEPMVGEQGQERNMHDKPNVELRLKTCSSFILKILLLEPHCLFSYFL